LKTKDDKKNEYQESVKNTSLFAGVQFYNILIQIMRTKAAGVFLGPAGIGIMSLLNSTIQLIGGLTNLGLATSAVKSVAEASAVSDENKIAVVVSVVRKLVWITGAIGALVCFFLAPMLSRLTFGGIDYTNAYRLLSLSILFVQLTSGQNILLQGLRKFQYLAKASVLGNTIGLIITVPLYYFLGVESIVLVLLLANVITFICAVYYTNKISIKRVSISLNLLRSEGSEMTRMGIVLSVQGIFTMLASYTIQLYITNSGSIEDVGFYNAGFAIVTTYVGMVFTAMGTDYYPRLSAVQNNLDKFRLLINQQAEISLILLAPIIVVFIVFIEWVIIALYSSEFLEIKGLMYWAIAAILFKALSWSLSYSILAQGKSILFFKNELFAISYNLIINVIFYKYFGLDGLGFSFFLVNMLYVIQMIYVVYKNSDFSFNNLVLMKFIIYAIIIIISLLSKLFLSNMLSLIIGTIITVITLYYSFWQLNKMMDVLSIIRTKFKSRKI
jgi:O-antigen/teichoic acid export membrane protein